MQLHLDAIKSHPFVKIKDLIRKLKFKFKIFINTLLIGLGGDFMRSDVASL